MLVGFVVRHELFIKFSRSFNGSALSLPVLSAFVFPSHPKRFTIGDVFVRSVLLRDIYRVSIAGILSLLLPWLALAQEQKADAKAAIHGTITDQTQAVVTGASVVLSNTAGFRQEAKTDEKGTYSF